MDQQSLYIIDASSLIGLYNWRPPGKHRAVWQKLDGLIQSDHLTSPDEVYTEIKKGEGRVGSLGHASQEKAIQEDEPTTSGFRKANH